MKTQLALVFSILAASDLHADVGDNITSITTLSGKTYRGVLVAEVNPDGVLFRHANGAGKVLFSDLPSDLRQALGYDAKKAEAYEKDLATRRERERLACIERDKEIARSQAGAYNAAAAQARVAEVQYAAMVGQQGYGIGYNYPVAIGWDGWRGGHRGAATTRTAKPAAAIPFRAGQISSGVPYAGTGNARFTNGVPALGSSFVPSQLRPQAPAPVSSGNQSGWRH